MYPYRLYNLLYNMYNFAPDQFNISHLKEEKDPKIA
jgi:hypothetical protein